MTEENYYKEESGDLQDTTASSGDYKIHISRVPTKFNEEIVQRILSDQFGSDAISTVELIYPRDDENEDKEKDENDEKEHRGFGFITINSLQVQEEALKMQTIKGGRKSTSTKLYTMYLRPYTENPDEANICYLWSQFRCPYGDTCKFTHSGPGGCKEQQTTAEGETSRRKKKGKCFAFKKGKCTKGDDCPFSHDFEPERKNEIKGETPKSEKDCINWKTKGKCRKGPKCPYRHDEEVQKNALRKLKKKKRAADGSKEKQPLSIRVFGMNYETTEQDIRTFFSECGPIQEVTFPTFEDSGRSKGYCGVWFSSPKAVSKAVELDGQELMGRWLRIQAGKMYLKQWEELHSQNTAKRPKLMD